jgi:hypothetical protein
VTLRAAIDLAILILLTYSPDGASLFLLLFPCDLKVGAIQFDPANMRCIVEDVRRAEVWKIEEGYGYQTNNLISK